MTLLIFALSLLAIGIAVAAGGKAEIGSMKFEGLTKWGGVGLAAIGLVVLSGIGADGLLKKDRTNFRVTDSSLTAVGSYTGPCPGDQLVEASITTKGGPGEVAYRLFTDNGFLSPVQTRQIERDGTVSFDLPIRVGRPLGGGSTAEDVARLRILSPSRSESGPAPFRIVCT